MVLGIGALVLLFTASIFGCGYPRVSEPALRLAQAIDTVANRRDLTQIDRARELVDQRFAEGEIVESERDLLLAILDRAEGGDWQSAEANARSLLHAQNGGDRPLNANCSCCVVKDPPADRVVEGGSVDGR
jgi:hypothetical protein